MKDIAFHISDIAENSICAGAEHIFISLIIHGCVLELTVTDDGCGMDAQMLRRITDPFCTTRTTRRVGLGLPFLFQNAEQCGGNVRVHSAWGEGTEVSACFPLGHVDCPPAGNLSETFMLLIAGNPSVHFMLVFSCDGRVSGISPRIPAGNPKKACKLREKLAENLLDIFGNRLN